MDDERISLTVTDETQKQPAQILAFDPTKGKEPIDLSSPFFTIKQRSFRECDHRNQGVTLDVSRRVAICKCGVEIPAFDALLIYAHAQQRLVYHVEFIKERERKEAEEKARRPFVRAVCGFTAHQSKHGRVLGYQLTLECGHDHYWDRRKPPRSVTCDRCYRASKLKEQGVASI